jgi:hypothetical protein
MNDMAAPRPPASSDHARHDPLLIAQLAAGDALPAEQGLAATRLVASCPECAQLAADLRTISAVVAWEPLPPRRRDFRLDPARAEQLRGSALQRFLRRLSLPQTAALRPAAAGILSLGLLFMVAGAAWPAGPAGEAGQPQASLPAVQQVELTTSDDAAAPVSPAALREAPGVEEAEDATRAADAQSVEAYAGGSAEVAGSDTAAGDALERAKVAPAVRQANPATDAAGAPAEVDPDAAAELFFTEVAQPSEAPGDQAPVGAIVAASPGAHDQLEDSAVEATSGGQAQPSVESLLLVAGGILALVGGALLLLAWLSRRAADPLLR